MSEIRTANVQYTGAKGPIFNLSFQVAALTLITFGIYRFWGKTRIRKYIWSSTVVDGDRFEYTGTGLEKFLGFLIAVVFLAIYLGLIQIVLTFLGLSLLTEARSNEDIARQAIAINLSLLSVVPFLFFAIYRARRYRMARTRWRGIRFGMDKGAWGYVWRAIGHYLLTFVTLGALLPRMTFHLEKYMADRTWFGDERVTQSGKWTDLYGAMKHIFIGLGLILLGAALAIALGSEALGGALGFVGYVWFMLGFLYYRVHSFGYLSSHKKLGERVAFSSSPQAGTVLRIYIVGGLLIGVVLAVFGGVAGIVAMGLTQAIMEGNPAAMGPLVPVLLAVSYIALILVLGAMVTALITQPVIAHYASTLQVHNVDALDAIRQRAADTGADAEGFADALDIGGAI